MMRIALLLASVVATACSSAAAASPGKATSPPTEAPMRVHLVPSAEPGCEPQCPEWIAAQGRIDADSTRQFRKVLNQLGPRKLPVFIDSGGGSVEAAFAIGRLVRAKDMDVAVTKTLLTPCSATDPACSKRKPPGMLLGVPQVQLSRCASACAFILAAGTRRLVAPATFVGVHQIRSFRVYTKVLQTYRVRTSRAWGVPVATRRTLVSSRKVSERTVETKTSRATYERIRRYFAQMGVGEGIMPLLTSTPSHSIRWLTQAELLQTRLATHWADGEELIGSAAPPAARASKERE